MKKKIRIAHVKDAEELLKIYAPSIIDSPISFETEVPSVKEFSERMTETLKRNPWIILEVGAQIAGYAYAAPYRARKAYQWSVELSVFLAPMFHRQGLGKVLYGALIEILKNQGYLNAYGIITLPNQASVALHESLGFKNTGIYEKVGFKCGAWRDVGWWHKSLAEYSVPPPQLISFNSKLFEKSLSTFLNENNLNHD